MSQARTLVTVPGPRLTIHMATPSKASPQGSGV